MKILTEPIGSIPRPKQLVDGLHAFAQQQIKQVELNRLFDEALKDTIQRFEATGSPVITDGEQTKLSFVTYPISGLSNLASDGVVIPFAKIRARVEGTKLAETKLFQNPIYTTANAVH